MFITTGNTSKYAHMAFSDDPKYSKYMFLDEIAEFTVGGKKHKITRTYADYLRWLNDKTRETSLKDAVTDIASPKTVRTRKKKAT
jgi:lysine/ornithine N-monooxygenase